MHFLATCTIGNKIVEILLSNGNTSENKTFWTKHVQYTWQMNRVRPFGLCYLKKMLTRARGVENVGKQNLLELMERFVLQVASTVYNIILFGVGCGRTASSCTELKRIQSAKCRVPHFSLPPILPFFWVAIFVYYAVLIL